MPAPSVTRQFLGTCVLVRVQLARASESFDLDIAFERLLACGKLTQDDVAFLTDFLEHEKPVKEQGAALDEAWAADAIRRVHAITSGNLNMGDSA